MHSTKQIQEHPATDLFNCLFNINEAQIAAKFKMSWEIF